MVFDGDISLFLYYFIYLLIIINNKGDQEFIPYEGMGY